MTAPVPAVTLDVLPLKRVLALEEAGNEILPNEPTPEEKPLALLGRIDFGQTIEKDSKKAKSGKEAVAAPPTVWPWQGLVDHLQQAHQELNIILDLITHVEANDAITVVNMAKPKLLPNEAFNEIALRSSGKIHQFRDVGKYLKKTAQALERQVEREAAFYGALMRLQRNWKVKRQRGVSAGPGGSAGFSIDLSYPLPVDTSSGSSGRAAALSLVNLDQDVTGLLQTTTPAGRPLNKLNLSLQTTQPGRTLWERQDAREDEKSEDATRQPDLAGTEKGLDRGVGEGVDTGAKGAQVVLRRIQAVIFDEQVFEWVGREALVPNSGMNVLGIGDTCLQFSLGHAASLTLELSESERTTGSRNAHDNEITKEDDEAGGKFGLAKLMTPSQVSDRAHNQLPSQRLYGRSVVQNESSLVVSLHQAFHQCVFGFPTVLMNGLVTFKSGVGKSVETTLVSKARDSSAAPTAVSGPGKEAATSNGASAIKHFSAIMRHRVLSSRVLAELEKQVTEIPHLQLFFHPTWHPRVSAWDLTIFTPAAQRAKGERGSKRQEAWFQCTIVLRDESLTVEGLEGESKFEAPSKTAPKEVLPLNKHSVGISELPTFLLFQIATELVSWLHDEAVSMGLKVTRDLLSVVFQLESCDDVAIVACPDVKAHGINWWMRTWSLGGEDPSLRDEMGVENGHHQRFLGPLSLDILRKVLLDLVSLESNVDPTSFD